MSGSGTEPAGQPDTGEDVRVPESVQSPQSPTPEALASPMPGSPGAPLQTAAGQATEQVDSPGLSSSGGLGSPGSPTWSDNTLSRSLAAAGEVPVLDAEQIVLPEEPPRQPSSEEVLDSARSRMLEVYRTRGKNYLRDCLEGLDHTLLEVPEASCSSSALTARSEVVHMFNAALLTAGMTRETADLQEKVLGSNAGELVHGRVHEASLKSTSAEGWTNRGLEQLLLAERSRERPGSSDDASELVKHADDCFDKALELDRDSARATLGKALVHIDRLEWPKALPLLRKILFRASVQSSFESRRENLKQVRWLIALCFNGLQRYDQMRNALLSVLDLDGENVEALCALFQIEMLPKASVDGSQIPDTSYLTRALEADKQHPAVLLNVANNFFFAALEQDDKTNGSDVDRFRQSEELLKRVEERTQVRNMIAEVHFQRGRIRHVQKQFEQAYKEYKGCCALQPEHFACKYGLSQVALHVQPPKYEEAIETLASIRKRRGNLPEVVKLEMVCRFRKANVSPGDQKGHREIISFGKLASTVLPDDIEVWKIIADAHHRINTLQGHENAAWKDELTALEHVARLSGKAAQDSLAKKVDTPQMWNNLGTLRAIHHDIAGANKAYSKGAEVAEELGKSDLDPLSRKENELAKITARFNSTCLLEEQADPSSMQTLLEYMELANTYDWFGLPLLQMSSHWHHKGIAKEAFAAATEATRRAPVMGALLQAEIARTNGEYKKSEVLAEHAVKHCSGKQLLYAHCTLGNICFEAAQHMTKKQERSSMLRKAMKHFFTVLQRRKDCKYACNGIGMVSAVSGNMGVAQKFFEYVNQQGGMKKQPALYVNMAHTFMKPRGKLNQQNRWRKSIFLYGMAKRLSPDDLSIRLYLASAQFEMKDYAKCIRILSDAMLIWPDDLLLRYNYAIALESFGVHLVDAEKKSNRIVGQDTGMGEVARALGLLHSAVRQFAYLEKAWSFLPDEERRQASRMAQNSLRFRRDMNKIKMHKEYCEDVIDTAIGERDHLKHDKGELDARMKAILEDRKREAQEKEVSSKEERERAEERQLEMEQQAINLMNTTSTFGLGQNLGEMPDKKPEGQATKAVRRQKEAKAVKELIQQGEEGDLPLEEGEASGTPKTPKPKAPRAPRAKGLSKAEKKEMKKQAKKDKKEQKKLKKEKKLGEGEGEGEAMDDLDDLPPLTDFYDGADGEPGIAAADSGGPAADSGGPLLPTAEAGPMIPDEEAKPEGGAASDEDSDLKKKKKKDKKDKKKKKKEKKKRKRGQVESESEEQPGDGEKAAEEGDEPPAKGQKTEDDKAMEQDLFGSGGESD